MPYTSILPDEIKIKLAQETVSSLILAPLERASIIVQCRGDQKENQEQFKSVKDVFIRIAKDQGFLHLWITAPMSLLRNFAHIVSEFLFYESIRSRLILSFGPEPMSYYARKLTDCILLGGMDFIVSSPFAVVNSHLAVDLKPTGIKKYKGIGHCVSNIWNSEGIAGFFKGYDVAFLSAFLTHSTVFLIFENTGHLALSTRDNPVWKMWLYFELILTGASIVSYPFETVRRRMITESKPGEYENSMDCLKKIVQSEGISGLYRGFFIRRITNALGNVISYLAFTALE
jgi:solute carrier family 25 (adenine nucleotide translocator) protein 4/5/6/31